MSRFGRVLDALFPSVPPASQARILAAMQGRTYQTPAPGVRGEAHPGPGQTSGVNGGQGLSSFPPGGADEAPDKPKETAPPWAAPAPLTPEGEATALSPDPRGSELRHASPSGQPSTKGVRR